MTINRHSRSKQLHRVSKTRQLWQVVVSTNTTSVQFQKWYAYSISLSLHFYLLLLLLDSCNSIQLNACCAVGRRPTFSKSLMAFVAVSDSELGCAESIFRRATSESWRQILPWSSTEEADAASHASHCCQHVCVPARQCTCAMCSWNSPASSAGNTGFYLCRSVVAKQNAVMWRLKSFTLNICI